MDLTKEQKDDFTGAILEAMTCLRGGITKGTFTPCFSAASIDPVDPCSVCPLREPVVADWASDCRYLFECAAGPYPADKGRALAAIRAIVDGLR